MNNLRKQAEVVRFVASARLFCGLLEVEPEDQKSWVHSVLAALADLYAATHHLTVLDLELIDDFPESSFDPAPEELHQIRHRIGRILGDDNLYWRTLSVRVVS